jgi:AICAR transformylase/IMP cyclohydrolase PurH
MEPIKVEEEARLKGKKYKDKEVISERKLPLILQGRLKSISPEIIMKILQKEKEKKQVYSIIGKN